MAPPEMGSFWCAGVGTGAAYQPSNRRGLPPLALSPAPSSTESPLGGRSVGPLGAIAPSARRAGLGVRNCAASGGGSALGAYWSASARTSPAQRRDGQPQRIDSQCGSTGPRAYAPTEAAPAELPPVSCFGRPELSLSGRRRVRSVSFAESPTRFTSPGAPRALGSSFASPGRLPSPAADGAEQDPADAVGDPPGARRDQLQTEKDKAAARRQQRALEPDDELTLARKLWWQVSPRISPGRRLCIVIITSRTFKVGVFLAILASSLVLALDSPYAWWALRYPERLAAVQSISVAFFFAVLFTLEVLLRLAAYREHFLIVRIFDGIEVSEPRPLYWNWMDIAVVAFAWLDVGLSLRPVGESNGAGWLLCMRLLRVARPLRSLSFLPAAKTVVETVVASIGSLGEAFKLLGFFILFFAILGAQLFHGDLRHRCVAADGSMPDPEEACVPVGDLLNTFGSFCPAAQLCLPVGESPDNGSRSYDNVAVATVSVFHAVAGAGFSDSMMPLLKGNGTPLVLLYYAAMVIVGGLFVVNIFVSVLERSYEASVEAAKEADEANKFKKEQDEEAAAAQKLELERPSTPSLRQPSTAETTGSAGTEKGSTPKGTRGRLLALRRPSTASKRVQRRRSARALASALTPGPLPPNRIDRAWADGYRLITCRRAISQVAPASPTVQAASSPEVYQAIKKSAENETGNETAEQGKRGKSFKKRAEVFVKSSAFQGVMTLCIVGSAVVAAVSVEPFIGEREREVTDWLDIGFTIVFVSEMAVKIFALTWAGYWSDAFNRFDFVLVVTGVLENVSSPIIKAATSAAGSSDQMVEGLATGLLLLSCSKAFRTVRLVRVAYQLDLRSVKELGSKFPNVVAALAAIVIVLTLVVFVYAVVLMNALGGAWADDEGIPTVRQHYDDIGWSMISVAQITLTADGYFEAHNAISEAPLSNPLLQRLYAVGMFLLFSFIILNGSLILLTLVTAVLVASFNPEEEAEEEEAAAAAQPREQPVEQQPPPPIVPAAPLAAPEPEQNDNDSGPSELFEFRLQICAHDANDNLVAVHTKCERDDTFPSRNTVKVANKQKYTLVFQVANTCVPFDSLLAVRVGEFDVPIRKQLRSNNEFVCEGFWDTTEIAPTGDKFRIQMPVRVAYLLGNEKYCRETEFILQMKVYDAKDSKKAQQGGTPLDCISCKFYRTSSRSVNYPTFLRT